MRLLSSVAASVIGTALLASPAAALTTFNLVGTVENGAFAGTMGTGSVTFDETKLELPPPDIDIDVDSITPSGVIIDGPPPDILPILMFPDFTLEFSIFDQTFTQADDIDFPEFPTLAFGIIPVLEDPDFGELPTTLGVIDGEFEFVPLFLDFFVSEETFFDGQNPTEIDQPGVFNIGFGPLFPDEPFGEFPDFTLQSIGPSQTTPTFTASIFVNNVPLPAGLPLMLTVIAVGAAVARAKRRNA